MNSKNNLWIFFLIAFIEGGCVMAAELIGAKLLAPWYGTSLYVWTSVMSLTLGGLALGYYFGSVKKKNENSTQRLGFIYLLAGVCLLAMPLTSIYVTGWMVKFDLLPAVVLSSFVLLLPPLFLLGTMSPLMIRVIQQLQNNDEGSVSGKVFSVSTIGGIFSTFITGFVLVPKFGLHTPLYICGALLLVCGFILLSKSNSKKTFLLVLLPAFVFPYMGFKKQFVFTDTIYAEDGIMGRLEVIKYYNTQFYSDTTQVILINNIFQSAIDLKKDTNLLRYSHVIMQNLKSEESKNILLFGLGGGTLANNLIKRNHNVTAVELDARIISVAKKYFKLSSKVNCINDDARHYIQQSDSFNKYDIIIFDVFQGEVPPSYAITQESISKVKQLLKADGTIIINTYGFLNSYFGFGNRSIIKTLQSLGFKINLCNVGTITEESHRNLLIYASQKEINQKLLDYWPEKPDTANAIILKDNGTGLDWINAEASLRWRKEYINNFIAISRQVKQN